MSCYLSVIPGTEALDLPLEGDLDAGAWIEVHAGSFAYDELFTKAEQLNAGLESSFASIGLPDAPDRQRVNELLVELREEFWIR